MVSREYDRAPPRRNEDAYASQQRELREPDGGRGRREYPPEYPPLRVGAEAGYPRRDEYLVPRRDDSRASDGYREYESARGDDRGVDARKYGVGGGGGGRGDYRSEYVDRGRADSQSYPSNVDRAQHASYPDDNHDTWPRGEGGAVRTSDQQWDRRAASPPREARGADAGDARNYNPAYGDAYAAQAVAGSKEGMRDAGSAPGAREVDSLPPNDLRKSLVRDASVSSGSWGGSQAGGAGAAHAPQSAAQASEGGVEVISDVEAKRRRQRAERFSAAAASQVCEREG